MCKVSDGHECVELVDRVFFCASSSSSTKILLVSSDLATWGRRYSCHVYRRLLLQSYDRHPGLDELEIGIKWY